MLIKTDVGGFGSTVLYPYLKDVKYVNKILPEVSSDADVDTEHQFDSIDDAVNRIKELELQLDEANSSLTTDSEEISDYATTYSSMKPKEAAAIFDTMTDNLSLVADILQAMDAESRANILGKMSADTAAKVTEIMEPDGM